MFILELHEKDMQTLSDILKSYLSDLRMEISDTDSQDFRDNLKDKEKFLIKTLAKLETTI